MKSIKNLAVATLAAFSLTSAASALSFSDTDGSPHFLSAPTYDAYPGSITGWLDITTGQAVNFNPATMTLTSASVAFGFSDTYDPAGATYNDEHDVHSYDMEYVTVTLDGGTFLSGIEVDGTHNNAPTSYDWTSASGALSGSFLTSLQTDGKLQYTITVTSGDTWFKGAKLDATGIYKQVPDAGSSLLLLGLGLLSFAGLKRRT